MMLFFLHDYISIKSSKKKERKNGIVKNQHNEENKSKNKDALESMCIV